MLTGIRHRHHRPARTGRARLLLGAAGAALLALGALSACGLEEEGQGDPPSAEQPADPTDGNDGADGVEGNEGADGAEGADDGSSGNDGSDDGGGSGDGSGSGDGGEAGGRTAADAWRAPFDEVGHEWSNGWVALPASAEDVESILAEASPVIREGTQKVELEVDCADGIDGTSLETTCTVKAEDESLDLPEVTWKVTGTAGEGGADLTVRNEG